jgi:hypothetical protein
VSIPSFDRFLYVLAAAILSATLAGPAHANSVGTLTLQDLIDGETFRTENGLLFSGFSADVDLPHACLGSLLQNILVLPGESGFSLTGPFFALAGQTGRIDLFYTVTSEEATLGIAAASLSSPGEVLGADAGLEVKELLKPLGGEEKELYTFADAPGMGGAAAFFDETVFDDLPIAIEVQKQIILSGGAHGGPRNGNPHGAMGNPHGVMGGWDGAGLDLIEQRFDTDVISTPEPGTLGLMGIGLAGLAVLRRRRDR